MSADPQAGSPEPQQAGWIKDARGRVVTQLDPVVMQLCRRPDIIEPEVLHEIAQQVGFGLTRSVRLALRLGLVGLAVFAIALTILIIALTHGDISTRRFFISLVPYCGIWSTLLGVWLGARNVRHQRIREVMLRHLRCPHCGYDIRGLPVEPDDGATICPECGCAWMLEKSDNAAGSGLVTSRVSGPVDSGDKGEHGRG